MSATMKAVVLEPQSPAWHTWRAAGVGGSDAPIIAAAAGLCKAAPWMNTEDELWKIKTGLTSDVFSGNWATRKGNGAEPLARGAFEKATGILLSPMYGEMSNPETSFVRASFDGVDFNGDVIGEMKLGSSDVHAMARENEVIGYYQPQLAHQALTAWGMPEEWKPEHTVAFVSYNPDSKEMLHVIKPAFEYRKLAEDLLAAEKVFWDRVQKNIEPCGEDWKGAAAAYLVVYAQMEALKKQEELAKARLIELLGEKSSLSAAGVSVTKQNRKGSIDFEKIVTEHTKLTEADIEAYRKTGSSSIVIRALK